MIKPMTMFTANCRGRATNAHYPNKVTVKSVDDFRDAVCRDYVLAEYKDGHRSIDDFISADSLPMDSDNTHSDDPEKWITPETIKEKLPGVPFYVHYSRNNMKAKGNHKPAPRAHYVFPINTETSAEKYAELKSRLLAVIPEFDDGAKDSARFFFGTENPEVAYVDGDILLDEFLPDDSFAEDIIPEGRRHTEMVSAAARVIKRYGDTDDAYQMFMQWAERCVPALEGTELDSIWKSAEGLYKKMIASPDYVPPEEYNTERLIPTDFTDVGQAVLLAREYAGCLRYSPSTDYIFYNGVNWVESKPMAQSVAQELTFRQMREWKHLSGRAYQDENFKKFLKTYKEFIRGRRSSKNITATLKEARPMLVVDQSDLDKDPYLLNTPHGTYDLRKGLEGRQHHCPEDLITKVTAVSPGDEGKQEWLDALELIFCGDTELIGYVQRIVGLAAIGKVYVEALIIAHGDGSNGKSTFWNVISRVLGSYSGNISADTLTVGCRRNVKPELAETKGKRLLIAAELEEGTRLNTSTIKQFCSTDEIFAEKKYKDPFSFIPSHTLVLYTNHLPKVGATDAGTWRRLMVIPFNAKFSGTGDKKNYADTLFDTSCGAVLSWIIEGAKIIIDEEFKLHAPECVKAAIEAYRDNNDWMTHFIDECCELDNAYRVKSGEFYTAYRNYCSATGEYARGTSDFYAALENYGLEKKKTNQGSFICGVKLKVNDFNGSGDLPW